MPLVVAGLALLLLASIVLQLANPQILRAFLDTAQAQGSPATLLHLALAFLAVAVVQQAAIVGATYLGENVAWTATNALRGELDVQHDLVAVGQLAEAIAIGIDHADLIQKVFPTLIRNEVQTPESC